MGKLGKNQGDDVAPGFKGTPGYTLPQPGLLPPGKIYYWHVKAKGSNGVSGRKSLSEKSKEGKIRCNKVRAPSRSGILAGVISMPNRSPSLSTHKRRFRPLMRLAAS